MERIYAVNAGVHFVRILHLFFTFTSGVNMHTVDERLTC
jgi:hypothetical protein